MRRHDLFSPLLFAARVVIAGRVCHSSAEQHWTRLCGAALHDRKLLKGHLLNINLLNGQLLDGLVHTVGSGDRHHSQGRRDVPHACDCVWSYSAPFWGTMAIIYSVFGTSTSTIYLMGTPIKGSMICGTRTSAICSQIVSAISSCGNNLATSTISFEFWATGTSTEPCGKRTSIFWLQIISEKDNCHNFNDFFQTLRNWHINTTLVGQSLDVFQWEQHHHLDSVFWNGSTGTSSFCSTIRSGLLSWE